MTLLLLLLACTDAKDPPPSADSSPPVESRPDSSPESVPPDSAETGHTGETATEPVPTDPDAEFDRWCRGAAWDASLTEATVGGEDTDYLGYLSSAFDAGTLETMKLIPTHPFQVTKIQMEYANGEGQVRVHLMTTYGRSYPGGWPDLDDPDANLITPVTLDVTDPGRSPEVYEIDVAGVWLEPGQHYMLVSEYVTDGGPTTSVESVPDGEASRALLMLPGEDTPYGLEGNFRMRLSGYDFCAWTADERWFGEDTAAAFMGDASSYAAITDVDSDGHVDVLTYPDGPRLYRGDGAGGFGAAEALWPEVGVSSMLVFGDVDNDGDQDAFAATYTGADDDGDGVTKAEGDCNDLSTAVSPDAAELTNGIDDDCDGVTDDGADTTDADLDGVSAADGDCDDTVSSI